MDLLDALRGPGGDLHAELLTSRTDFERAHAAGGDRRLYEDLLQDAYGGEEEWYLPAICQA